MSTNTSEELRAIRRAGHERTLKRVRLFYVIKPMLYLLSFVAASALGVLFALWRHESRIGIALYGVAGLVLISGMWLLIYATRRLTAYGKCLDSEPQTQSDLERLEKAVEATRWVCVQLCPDSQMAAHCIEEEAVKRGLAIIPPKKEDLVKWSKQVSWAKWLIYSWLGEALIVGLGRADSIPHVLHSERYFTANYATRFIILFEEAGRREKIIALIKAGGLPEAASFFFKLTGELPADTGKILTIEEA